MDSPVEDKDEGKQAVESDVVEAPVADDKDKEEVVVNVKREAETETIKNYAEHTMNELLGLFGYEDKVDSTDTENLNLENYADNKDEASGNASNDVKRDKRKPAAKLTSRLRQRFQPQPADDNAVKQQHMNVVTALKRKEDEKETEKEEEQDTKSESEESTQQCNWCEKQGSKQLMLDTPSGVKVFCSEVCFTQCRRASFKNSKICDWCKHVRHTVNYVALKDGDVQLQFCSEKCLNQYKMSVFCKETQELSRKLSKSDSVGDGKDEEPGKDEILITPELWLAGRRPQRTEDSMESVRESISRSVRDSILDSERSHGNNNTEHKREHSSGRSVRTGHFLEQSLDLSNKHAEPRQERSDSTSSSRVYLLDRVKQEVDVTTAPKPAKRSVASKETDKATPAIRSEKSATPPVQPTTSFPPHLLHPAMAPWLHQAQLMGGTIPPGMLPYSQLAPMMMAGFAPPSSNSASEASKLSPVESEHSHSKREHGVHIINNASPSPRPEHNITSAASTRHGKRTPAGVSGRRTSSLFPMDFPHHLLQHGGIPTAPFQAAPLPESAIPRPPLLPSMPPVTVMLPFPVVLPLPVPIPIPIPLTMDQLTNMFGHKKAKEEETTATTSRLPTSSQQQLNIDTHELKDTASPLPVYMHSPQSVVSSGSDFNQSYGKYEIRVDSRNSCPDMSSYSYNEIRAGKHEVRNLKRSRTPESLDLSRTSKVPRYEFSSYMSQSDDGVIDLSAHRGNGHRSEDNCSESGTINGSVSDGNNSAHDNGDTSAGGKSVPKIHIITHKDETPLNAPLPLPPTEHPYSSRRGLILDAPAVPKKSRSPSPERKLYVRNVPRDIIEAARRRCSIRARIRTK